MRIDKVISGEERGGVYIHTYITYIVPLHSPISSFMS